MRRRWKCGIDGDEATPPPSHAASTPRLANRRLTKSVAAIAPTPSSATRQPATCRNSNACWPRSARMTARLAVARLSAVEHRQGLYDPRARLGQARLERHRAFFCWPRRGPDTGRSLVTIKRPRPGLARMRCRARFRFAPSNGRCRIASPSPQPIVAGRRRRDALQA